MCFSCPIRARTPTAYVRSSSSRCRPLFHSIGRVPIHTRHKCSNPRQVLVLEHPRIWKNHLERWKAGLKLAMANGIVNGGHVNGRLRKDLMAGHAEGAAFGGMVGLGETYLPAFVLAVGLGEITAGLVASVPLLAGGLMQTISPMAIRRLGSYKRWVLICAFVQAVSFVPMIIAAARGRVSATAILLVAAVYWASGLATGPAWNTWMGALVPPCRPGSVLRTSHACFPICRAGRVRGRRVPPSMGRWSGRDARLAFLGLFVAAGVCRLLSLGLLAVQQEPALLRENIQQRIPTREILLRMRDTGVHRLLLYLVVVQGSVQLAGPFFTPFMFEKLRLSYGGYVALIAMAFVTKIAMLPAWGSVAHRLGAMRLLWLGGIGIVPLSAMWIFSGNFGWLLFVQALSGVSWGAYELGFFLMFFDSIPDDERTGVLTFYNLGNTVAWVLGSAIGGLLLYSLGTDRFGYLLLFGISSIGRCLPCCCSETCRRPRHLRVQSASERSVFVRWMPRLTRRFCRVCPTNRAICRKNACTRPSVRTVVLRAYPRSSKTATAVRTPR